MKLKLILVLLFPFTLGFAQLPDYLPPKFQNLSLKDGLSNLHITAIHQDDLGYVWIATARGLNRYDGIDFKQYYYNDDSLSLYHDNIASLHKTNDGKLLCGTLKGLNVYDPSREKMMRVLPQNVIFNSFTRYKGVSYGLSEQGKVFAYAPETITMKEIISAPSVLTFNFMIADEKSGIWGLSKNNDFLINYDPENDFYEKYHIPGYKGNAVGGILSKVYQYIFLILPGNIYLFDVNTMSFTDVPPKWNRLTELKNEEITFVSEAEDGILWIGTNGGGLFIFDMAANDYTNFNRSKSEYNVESSSLSCFFKDDNQNIWIGSFDRGVDISFNSRRNFNYDPELNKITRNEFISGITSDANENYYIGTRFNGLYIYNARTKKHVLLNTSNTSLNSNNIRKLVLDSRGQLWISTHKSLYLYQKNTGFMLPLKLPSPNRGIVSFCEHEGKMLAGTDLQGLLVYDLNGNMIKQCDKAGPNITQILKLEGDRFIMSSHGVGGGIFEYHLNTDSVICLNSRIKIEEDKLNEIVTLYFDSDSILWMGSFNYGLYRYNIKNESVSVLDNNDGLPSRDITAIMEDNDGRLWISTAYGLSQFDKDKKFVNYFYNEGLENIQFHQKAVHKNKFGSIFFGGNFGLTYFNPANFGATSQSPPRIILESLSVSNVSVKPGDETGILNESLNFTKKITLDHTYATFSIHYHAFDYSAARNIKYAYILDGFHQKWNNVGDENFVSFSNLKPGDYIFMVKAQNNKGIWSAPTTLAIVIKPAPWKTVWAILIYILLIGSGIYLWFQLALKNRLYKQELTTEHNERLREKEVSRMKLRFFTNISHEIRTPLTLIKGNVDLLEEEFKKANLQVSSMSALRSSTERLLRLVNQILSFRKMENDALDLKVVNSDLIKITKELLSSFEFAASAKNIRLTIQSECQSLSIPLDQDKYEKIISNLISNSLKFSNENGTVSVLIKKLDISSAEKYFSNTSNENEYVEIAVVDHGKGIPAKLLPNIFDRFAQSISEHNIQKPDYSGTGIGLNFTKALIDLHRGYMAVSSVENVETCFSFVLPINSIPYSPETIVLNQTSSVFEQLEAEIQIPDEQLNEEDVKKRCILLVEDDMELNKFIRVALSDKYLVHAAFNGVEAFAMAQEQLPDIIISDIMMPEMDGITFCRKVREDELISHIPIILLTAKSENKNLIKGYRYGADAYITKPFDLNLLKARIANLIQLRIQLQKAYQTGALVELKSGSINQFELNFMKKVDAAIEANYPHPEFNIQSLSDKLFTSRTSFYRKFMNITDISPKDYLTKFRIQKSVELIEQGKESFGEISFLCGFSSQSMFSTAFKKEKGLSPLQYKKQGGSSE